LCSLDAAGEDSFSPDEGANEEMGIGQGAGDPCQFTLVTDQPWKSGRASSHEGIRGGGRESGTNAQYPCSVLMS